MQLLIAAVGRLKDDAERVLVDRYVGRVGQGRALGIGPMREIEVPESRRATSAERKSDEGDRLISAAKSADLLILMDETGKTMASEPFARFLGNQLAEGIRCVAFLLGGPDGHGNSARRAARATLSLGTMTLPHGLARAVLAEQLYRATTILAGHPYHRS